MSSGGQKLEEELGFRRYRDRSNLSENLLSNAAPVIVSEEEELFHQDSSSSISSSSSLSAEEEGDPDGSNVESEDEVGIMHSPSPISEEEHSYVVNPPRVPDTDNADAMDVPDSVQCVDPANNAISSFTESRESPLQVSNLELDSIEMRSETASEEFLRTNPSKKSRPSEKKWIGPSPPQAVRVVLGPSFQEHMDITLSNHLETLQPRSKPRPPTQVFINIGENTEMADNDNLAQNPAFDDLCMDEKGNWIARRSAEPEEEEAVAGPSWKFYKTLLRPATKPDKRTDSSEKENVTLEMSNTETGLSSDSDYCQKSSAYQRDREQVLSDTEGWEELKQYWSELEQDEELDSDILQLILEQQYFKTEGENQGEEIAADRGGNDGVEDKN